MATRRIVDRGIGEEVDPQPCGAARHEHQVEALVLLRKLGEHRLELGFQQLEPGNLAIAPVGGTIEALGTSGRMVGIVTHVPALADRVPVRYRVTRTDRSARVDREDL